MAVVTENREIARGIYSIRLSDAPTGLPGQFVMLRLGLDPFLNRPISICDCEPEERSLTLTYQVVGRGTQKLASYQIGQTLDVFGPYGNGFPLERGAATLIGGGIGTAPLLLLARVLRANDPERQIRIHLGFREEAFLEWEFRRYTDDLQINIGGLVTGDVDFTGAAGSTGGVYYACGPALMLEAAAQKAAQYDATLYVSLEAHMACGVGACLGCRIAGALGNRSVCKDGPVFPYQEVFA